MDKNQTEGNPTNGEGVANSDSSSGQGQPSSDNLAEVVAQLQKKLDSQETVIRSLQSGKDKAVDRAIKSQEETLNRLAQYLGVDEAKVATAQKQLVLDELIAERLGQSQSTQFIQGRVEQVDNPAGFTVADAISEVERYNLPTNDPEFISLLRDRSFNKEKVKDFILKKVAPTKPPSPADVVQSPVTSPATGKSADALLLDYRREMLTAPKGKAGEAVRRAIKERFANQGVPVDNIIFS